MHMIRDFFCNEEECLFYIVTHDHTTQTRKLFIVIVMGYLCYEKL